MGWMVVIAHRSSKSISSANNIFSYVLIESTFSLLQIAESFLLKAKARFHMSAPPGESLALSVWPGRAVSCEKTVHLEVEELDELQFCFCHVFTLFLSSRPSICWWHLVVLSISNLAKKRNLWIAVFSSSTPLQWTTFAVVMGPLWKLCFEGRLAEVRTEHTSLKHPLWTSYLFSTS